ncbi:MAG: hypothetical protein GHHEDOFH_01573 [Pseudorhodoplanes sp.]|nr:hypothetical protein [Pseudorhodoplanes sp.]
MTLNQSRSCAGLTRASIRLPGNDGASGTGTSGERMRFNTNATNAGVRYSAGWPALPPSAAALACAVLACAALFCLSCTALTSTMRTAQIEPS